MEAEERDRIRHGAHAQAEDERIDRDRPGQLGGVDDVEAPRDKMPEQDNRYRPAMLRRADEQPEQGSHVDQNKTHPVDCHEHACRRQFRDDRPSRRNLEPTPHELGMARQDQENVQEHRDRKQDQVAAGQPAAGRGVLEDEAETGGRDRRAPQALKSEPGDLRSWGDGGRLESDAQHPQGAEQRDPDERECGGHRTASPTVDADGGQDDGRDQRRPDGGSIDVSSGHGDAPMHGRVR